MSLDITCSVCLLSLLGNVSVSLCGHPNHAIHEQCMQQMVQKAYTMEDAYPTIRCPQCRLEVTQSTIFKLTESNDALLPQDLHITTSNESILVSVFSGIQRSKMPPHDLLQTRRMFLEHGLKELVPRFRVENKRQHKYAVTNADFILQTIAMQFHIYILDAFKTRNQLRTYFRYNRSWAEADRSQYPAGNYQTFKGRFQHGKSIILYELDRTFWSEFLAYDEQVEGFDTLEMYSEDISMHDFETLFKWNLEIAMLDTAEKKDNISRRVANARFINHTNKQ